MKWCFYCTQSDIPLCGIARFSRGNKKKLRTFKPLKNEKKKKKNSQPQTKFAGSYKKKSVRQRLILSCNFNNLKIFCYNALEFYQ